MSSILNLFDQNVKFFASKLLIKLENSGILDEIKEVDHICYRVTSVEHYEQIKNEMKTISRLLSETYINGRPIASFKLDQPIEISSKLRISLVEIPAPRADASYGEGFEHIEVVIKSSLEDFLQKYNQLTFDTSNFHAKTNRDIKLKFDCGLVKFHELSLEEVIEQEINIIAALKKRPIILFDLDDTLIVSKEAFLKTAHKALECFLKKAINFETVRENARPTFPEFLANFGIHTKEDIQSVLAKFQEEWPKFSAECSVPIGIQSLLSCLFFEGFIIYVWTARDKITTFDILKTLGLLKYIDQINGYDGINVSKPNPTPEIIKLCEGVSDVVMIGDSQADANGAANLGAKFIQAAWIHKAELQNVTASQIGRTPLEVLSKLF